MVKSIAKVGYSIYNETAGTYGTVKELESDEAGGRNFTATPRGEVSEIYADGQVVIATDNNDGYDIELELLALIDDIEKDWYGQSINSTTHALAEFASGNLMPKFCLILAEETVDGNGLITYYPMCQCSARNTYNTKTSEGTFDPVFPTVSISARPNDNKLVKYRTVGTSIPSTLPDFPESAAENEEEPTPGPGGGSDGSGGIS